MNWRTHACQAGNEILESVPGKAWCDLYERFLSTTPDASFVIDTQCRVLCWNPGAARLYGITSEQMLGGHLRESHEVRWLEEDQEERALRSLDTLGCWRGMHVHVLKDGRELYVECSASVLKNEEGVAVALLVLIRDLTQRRKLEELLAASQERLLMAQRVARLGWFDWDIFKNISIASDEALQLHGLPPNSLRGGYEEWKRYVHPDDLFDIDRRFALALRNGGEHTYVTRVIWPDQSVHWLQVRIKVFQREDGTAERVLGVLLDVTDIKVAEELARISCQELERRVVLRTAALQESRQEMEAFVYSISHDLRAPLRAMGGFAQAVRQDEQERLSPTSRESLNRVEQAARRMDALICALVDYTGMQHREVALAPVALDDAVDHVLLSFNSKIQQKEASIVVHRPLASVTGDSFMLRMIVANLVSNALKFVAPHVRPQVTIWTEEHGGQVRLFVKDNGIGIEPEHLERVFKVFERLHSTEQYSGVGIGLAIARKGVERLGGKLGVTSNPGEGSCFWIEFPAAKWPVEPRPP